MDFHQDALGLGEAADLARCSRDTIRRAAQKGDLKAEMGPGVRGPQWWIKESDLYDWLENRDASAEHSTAAPQQQDAELSTAAKHAQHSSTVRSSAQQQAEWTVSEVQETPGPIAPPAEVYIALIDRLSRAERRSVELELQLRQSQHLLTENAESITEKEALAMEARAKLEAVESDKQAELARMAAELETAKAKEVAARESEAQLRASEEARKLESERLQAELETTRQQLLEAQKPSGLFSWLGLRKKRSSPATATSKAG